MKIYHSLAFTRLTMEVKIAINWFVSSNNAVSSVSAMIPVSINNSIQYALSSSS